MGIRAGCTCAVRWFQCHAARAGMGRCRRRMPLLCGCRCLAHGLCCRFARSPDTAAPGRRQRKRQGGAALQVVVGRFGASCTGSIAGPGLVNHPRGRRRGLAREAYSSRAGSQAGRPGAGPDPRANARDGVRPGSGRSAPHGPASDHGLGLHLPLAGGRQSRTQCLCSTRRRGGGVQRFAAGRQNAGRSSWRHRPRGGTCRVAPWPARNGQSARGARGCRSAAGRLERCRAGSGDDRLVGNEVFPRG